MRQCSRHHVQHTSSRRKRQQLLIELDRFKHTGAPVIRPSPVVFPPRTFETPLPPAKRRINQTPVAPPPGSTNNLLFRDQQPAFASGRRRAVRLLASPLAGNRVFPVAPTVKTGGKLPSRGTCPVFRMSAIHEHKVSRISPNAPRGAG